MLLNIIYLLTGFIILVYGANFLVDGGAALAHRLKVPNIVIGLTVVAFGTSTPELVVNIISSIEGSSALALGNVLGSNIFNIMAILGVTALFVPIGIKRSTTWIEIPLAVLAAVLILILANGEPAGIITRAEGFCLLCFFAVFIAYTLFIAKRGGQETEEVNKKNADIAIGNVVGSNIFNTFLILGASAGISPLKVTADSVTDLWVNIGVSVLLFIFVFTGKGRQINRWEGALFLTLYITYLTLLIIS